MMMDERKQSKTIIFVTDSMSLNAGGRTSSIFRRAKLFAEMGHRVYITTSNFRANYRDIFNYFCIKHNVQGVHFLNVFEFLAGEQLFKEHKCNDLDIINNGIVEINNREKRVFDADNTLLQRQISQTNDINVGKWAKVVWYATSGRPYLIQEAYDDGNPNRYIWIRKDGSKKYFHTINDAREYWYADIEASFENMVFFQEYPEATSLLLDNKYSKKRFNVVAMIHENIFSNPYTFASQVLPNYDKMLSRFSEYSSIVVLTHKSKEHIESIYNISDKLSIIPHPIDLPLLENSERQEGLIVICSRLSTGKRIDHAVRAFKIINDKLPYTSLHIYGAGSEYDTLRELISDLDLQSSAKLMGVTDAPLSALAKAELTLVTSESEGYSLAIFEAMAMGVPVVTYDFLYGPQEFVINGENGFIVNNGDVDALADAAIEILQHSDKRQKMSAGAIGVREGVERGKLAMKWNKVFDNIEKEEEGDMRNTIIFFNDSMSTKSGGRVASIFRRAKLFSEMGHDIYIATANFRACYRDVLKHMSQKYGTPGVKLINLFEFLAEDRLYSACDNLESNMIDEGVIETTRGEDVIEYEYYDGNGIRLRKKIVDATNDSKAIIEDIYYDTDGERVYLRGNNEKGWQWNRKDGSVVDFANLKEIVEFWAASINSQFANPIILQEWHDNPKIFTDNKYSEDKISSVVAMIHGTLYQEPYIPGSPRRKYYDNVLKNSDSFAATVTLTSQQRDDLIKEYGQIKNLFVIPHPLEISAEAKEIPKTNKRIVVVVSRLDKVKQIDHIIKAFKAASRTYPDAQLHIYGEGKESKHLNRLVKALGIEKKVLFKGFTSKPLERIRESSFTVCTSLHEGLCLAIQEALTMGTPVISYDFRYGPREFIQDGINGYIVTSGDIDSLARKMRKLFFFGRKLKKMSQNAENMEYGKTREELRDIWNDVFNTITE